MTEIEKLLAVLELLPDEYPFQQEHRQCKMLVENGLANVCLQQQGQPKTGLIYDISSSNEPLYEFGDKRLLADLAFKLRDEAVAREDGNWCEAEYEVFLHIIGEENEKDAIGLDTWCSMYAKPIHWIIIALIAKQLAKDK